MRKTKMILEHVEKMYEIFETFGGQLMKFVEVVRLTFVEQQSILEVLEQRISKLEEEAKNEHR